MSIWKIFDLYDFLNDLLIISNWNNFYWPLYPTSFKIAIHEMIEIFMK